VNGEAGRASRLYRPGNTDDPSFNTISSSSALVNATSANILTDTAFTGLTTTGCAGGNLLHFQIVRQRYDPADTYEGWVFVNGGNLQFGMTQ
jgi:hypothetical protein